MQVLSQDMRGTPHLRVRFSPERVLEAERGAAHEPDPPARREAEVRLGPREVRATQLRHDLRATRARQPASQVKLKVKHDLILNTELHSDGKTPGTLLTHKWTVEFSSRVASWNDNPASSGTESTISVSTHEDPVHKS